LSFVAEIIKDSLKPRRMESAADWLRMYFYSHTGEAFSAQQSPWVVAPQGPCWAFDSIQFRTIWLQWAARMFKTNFGLAMLMRLMDQRPEETMFATPDETNCKGVFGRLWKMIEHCPRLRDEAPIRQRQSKTQIKLRRSTCHGAWPRGKSRLADKSIRIGHGNEIDKWVMESTSTEGDPLARFLKRGSEYPDRKFVLESTPSVRGKSNVESGRMASTNHRYHVPCPHCCKFQTIEFGDGSSSGGIFWEKTPAGETDKDLARRTAHYVCRWCEGKVTDQHRPWMMNRGVWVPAGCEVDHERAMDARELPTDDMSWLRGKPVNWGPDYGSQISVFYALFHGWGDIAYDYLNKVKSPAKLRQWMNEDKGETWEAKRTKSAPERIAERLATTIPRGMFPQWVKFLTCTIDRQAADGGFVKWVILGHGDDERSHVVDYGISATLQETWDVAICRQYQRHGGGIMLRPALSAADSGWDAKATYDFCNDKPSMFACKGSSTDLGGRPYRLAEIERGENQGQMLFTVNTDYWESDVNAAIEERQPGEYGSLSLCCDAARDLSFVHELCNGVIADSIDNRGNAKLLWVKKDENQPNDFRDAIRYGRALASLIVEHGGVPAEAGQVSAREPARPRQFVREPEDHQSGGWIRRRSS